MAYIGRVHLDQGEVYCSLKGEKWLLVKEEGIAPVIGMNGKGEYRKFLYGGIPIKWKWFLFWYSGFPIDDKLVCRADEYEDYIQRIRRSE